MINQRNVVLVFLFAAVYLPTAFGQLYGNGKLETRTFYFPDFSRLSIATPAEVYIDASATEAALELTTDANIFSHLELVLSGQQLSIAPGTWIEPSQLVFRIKIPSLEGLETGGYGTYLIEDLQTENFSLVNPVGTVTLSGQVGEFDFTMATGTLDARLLSARKVRGTIESFGFAQINATAELNAVLNENGTLTYQQKPERISQTIPENGRVLSAADYEREKFNASQRTTLNFRLRNNSKRRIQARVEGPRRHPFSYGFALNAGQRRKEEWPVGTKVFMVTKNGSAKLLLTVEPESEGRVLDLFDD